MIIKTVFICRTKGLLTPSELELLPIEPEKDCFCDDSQNYWLWKSHLPACEVWKGWRLNLQRRAAAQGAHLVAGGARLVVSPSAWILLTLFSWWASEDSEEKIQTSEPGARSPPYEMRNASCRTLRESPDKKFVSYHKFPPLNYSCAAIIFYILFDSWESVGVKTVLWSGGNVGRRLTRRVKKLAVARPGFDCSFSLSSNRVGQQFFLPLAKQADNTKWQPISVWYMTSFSLWLCTALLCKICWQH